MGLLAVDIFSCGGDAQKTKQAAMDLHKNIVKLNYLMNHMEFIRTDCPRFPYDHNVQCVKK